VVSVSENILGGYDANEEMQRDPPIKNSAHSLTASIRRGKFTPKNALVRN